MSTTTSKAARIDAAILAVVNRPSSAMSSPAASDEPAAKRRPVTKLSPAEENVERPSRARNTRAGRLLVGGRTLIGAVQLTRLLPEVVPNVVDAKPSREAMAELVANKRDQSPDVLDTRTGQVVGHWSAGRRCRTLIGRRLQITGDVTLDAPSPTAVFEANIRTVVPAVGNRSSAVVIVYRVPASAVSADLHTTLYKFGTITGTRRENPNWCVCVSPRLSVVSARRRRGFDSRPLQLVGRVLYDRVRRSARLLHASRQARAVGQAAQGLRQLLPVGEHPANRVRRPKIGQGLAASSRRRARRSCS